MMSFGWRPMMSCYASMEAQQAGLTTSTQQALEQQGASCPSSPTWWYAALAIAAAAGLARGSGRK